MNSLRRGLARLTPALPLLLPSALNANSASYKIPAGYQSAKQFDCKSYYFYPKIIPDEYSKLQKIWSKTLCEFDVTIKTPLVEGIANNTLTKDEFSNFLLPDLIYLKKLSHFLKKRADNEDDPEIKEVLQKRSEMFLNSYHKYKQQFRQIDFLDISNDEFISKHFDYLNKLNNKELMLEMLPCIATFRGIGLYLEPKVLNESQWREFVERRVRQELVVALNDFAKNAEDVVKQMGEERSLEILKKNMDFDNEFIKRTMNGEIKLDKLKHQTEHSK